MDRPISCSLTIKTETTTETTTYSKLCSPWRLIMLVPTTSQVGQSFRISTVIIR